MEYDDRFTALRRMFFIGAAPIWEVKSPWYNVYRICAIICMYLSFITMVLNVVKNYDDLEEVAETVRPGLSLLNIMWSHFFLSMNMEGLRKLMVMVKNFSWSEFPQRDPETGSITMASLISRIQIFIWKANFCDLSLHIVYLFLRIVTGSKNTFFFNCWFPLDMDSPVNYSIILTIQGIGSVAMASIRFGVMCLYAVLIAVGCTKLQKLHISIQGIKQSQEPSIHLVRCIKHHQEIKKYMHLLDDTFHMVLLGPMLCAAAELCFAAFTAINLSGNFEEMIQILLVVFAVFLQLFCICFFGSELTKESGKVRQVIWESEWIGSQIPYQRNLLFMMAASEEFVLTAGKIIPINRHTFMLVLNNSYSYLMFLINMVDSSPKQKFTALRRMFFFGAAPMWEVKSPWYNIYRICVIICMYLTFIGALLNVIKNSDDLEEVSETMRPGITMVNILWSHFFLSMNKEGLRKLMAMVKNFSWSELPQRDPETGSNTMASLISRIQIFVWKSNIFVLTLNIVYLVLRIATGSNKQFFYNCWLPLDMESSVVYSIILTMQGIASLVLSTIIFAVMGLYAVLVAVGCTQLQKLQISIQSIKQSQEPSIHLVRCIKHHQEIKKYMHLLDNTFHMVLLGPLFCVAAELCFSAFTAINLSGKLEMIQIVLLVFAMFLQLFCVCFFGSELTKESGKVRQVAWESDWVGSQIPYQRNLLIMMTASQEFVLTAGKIIPINRHTFMVVLNQSYSYLMFLINMVDSSPKEK